MEFSSSCLLSLEISGAQSSCLVGTTDPRGSIPAGSLEMALMFTIKVTERLVGKVIT